jgi:hypothetical protein
MRIRLRVPKDESPAAPPKQAGVRAWFQSLFSPASGARKCPPAPSICDKRWAAHGETRFLFAGRRARRVRGAWESHYLFDVLAPGDTRPRRVRIVLPESFIDAWQEQSGRRLSEAARRDLARQTLVNLLDLGRLPEAITITADAVAALPV